MIKPTKYPVGPDDMADLFDQAANQGKNGKQDTLVSGTNIKTVNGNTLLGSGDLTVSSTPSWGSITGTLSSQSDLNTALSGKEASITAGTPSQYYRGDKTFQTLDKSAVGLGNVDNTSDANKPVSTATQTALDGKQATLVSNTNIKTVNSTSLLGPGDITITNSPYAIAGNSLAGSAITGTTANTQAASTLVNSSNINAAYNLQIRSKIYKSTGSLATTVRLYINTANNLTGATLLATAASMTTGPSIQHFWRDIAIVGSQLLFYPSATASSNDFVSFTPSTFTFAASTNYYFIIAIQHSNTTDSAQSLRLQVLRY